MALTDLLRRTVPLEYWGNQPASKWMVAATVVAAIYVVAPMAGDGIGADPTTLFEATPLLLAYWTALLAGWLMTRRAAPGWTIHLHRAGCVVYVAPVAISLGALIMGVLLSIALAVGIAKGVLRG